MTVRTPPGGDRGTPTPPAEPAGPPSPASPSIDDHTDRTSPPNGHHADHPAGIRTRLPGTLRKKAPAPTVVTPPSRRLHPLRTEALRGFAPWAAAGMLITLAWALGASADRWQGSWGETTALLSTGAGLIGAPFALAAGAWQGGRERRLRMTELRASAARGRLVQLLTAALPLACWLAAAYGAAAAGALLACAPYASAGGPQLTVFVGTALSLAACTVLGHVAGQVLPWRLTAPALALCGYVLFGVLAEAPSNLRYLALAQVREVGDRELPVWWYPLVSALWAAGLAATAVLAHAGRRRVIALLPLTAALGTGALLVQAGDGLLRDNPLVHRQVCDDSTTPAVCVNAAYPGLLPDVTRALSGLTGRLEGVQNLPVRFEDLGRDPHEDETQLPMLTPFGWSAVRGKVTDPQRYAWEAAQLMVRTDCEREPSERRIPATDEAVLRWLAPEAGSGDIRDGFVARARQRGDEAELARYRAEDRAYARLVAMADDQRRAWLSRYFATAQDCDPDPKEVPSL